MGPRLLLALALSGLPLGAMYALQAMGIVLVYKTSGVFNFAQGAIGMTAAFVASAVGVSVGLPAWLGVLAGLATGVGIGAAMERLTMRPVSGSLRRTVITLGWLLALQGIVGVLFGTSAGRQPVNLFSSATALNLPGLGVAFGWDQLGVLVIAAVVAVGLGAYFRRAHLGTAMRAVADAPEAAQLLGVRTNRVAATAWMLGAGLAALSGVLVTPLLGTLDTVTLIVFTVQALAAALVGGLRSLPLTFLGGIGLGMIQPVVGEALGNPPGVAELVALLVILGALLVRRHGGRADVGGDGLGDLAPPPQASAGRRRRVLIGGATAVVVLPFLLGPQANYDLADLLAWSLAILSIVLLTGVVGQLSLCQAVFMAVGGFGAGIAVGWGLPVLLALAVGALLAAGAALLVGLPALRLRGLELAVATLALSFTADRYLFRFHPLVGSGATRPVPRPGFADQVAHGVTGARAFTLLVLLVVVASGLAVASLRRGRSGTALTALRRSEAATAAAGFSPISLKLRGFALSGFLAGLSGALFASLTGAASSAPFDFTRSITLVAFALVAGVSSVGGTVLGGALVIASTLSAGGGSEVASGAQASLVTLLSGVGLTVVVLAAPGGIAGLLRRSRLVRLVGLGGRPPPDDHPAPPARREDQAEPETVGA